MPDAQFKIEGAERVGALVGGELARNSLIALGLGILGILIFVTFRFELSFAVGAIVALLHDVIITVGVFSLLHRELTLTMVGAILTIAGYSINDTIVVYDRIREGLASGRRGSIEQIMNDSINQTLSRTILTSTVTLANKTGQTSDGKAYQVAGGLAANNNAKIVEFLGQTVTVTGEVSEMHGMIVISADSAKLAGR